LHFLHSPCSANVFPCQQGTSLPQETVGGDCCPSPTLMLANIDLVFGCPYICHLLLIPFPSPPILPKLEAS
jgi:hypothetical protein